jgi:hypothetical protein
MLRRESAGNQRMTPTPPPEREVALYEALIATHPEFERKGKSSPYTSINGNMFTILSADGALGMRLGDTDDAQAPSQLVGHRTAKSLRAWPMSFGAMGGQSLR